MIRNLHGQKIRTGLTVYSNRARTSAVSVPDGIGDRLFNSKLHIENLLVRKTSSLHKLLDLKGDPRHRIELGRNDNVGSGGQDHTPRVPVCPWCLPVIHTRYKSSRYQIPTAAGIRFLWL